METELIKRAIKDQEEEVLSKFNSERIIDREYSTEIQRHITKANAVVITGVRRSGKSTEAILLVKGKRHAHLNFDDPSLEGMKGPDLVKVTELRFTHVGLAPKIECYDACSDAWDFYIKTSLRNFIMKGEGQPNSKEKKEK